MLIGDAPLAPKLIRSWRSQIGYVAQDTFLLNDTVRANLLWYAQMLSEEEIVRVLPSWPPGEFVFGASGGDEDGFG